MPLTTTHLTLPSALPDWPSSPNYQTFISTEPSTWKMLEGKFAEAEKEFIRAGKPKEAVLMYTFTSKTGTQLRESQSSTVLTVWQMS